MNINLSDINIFKHLELLSKKQVEGFITGLHKSPFHGFSVEFAEHKLYNQGESTKHIDWKVYAKTERLYTKKYEEETNLRCFVLLDASGSMFFPQDKELKIRFSALSTACLFQLFVKQRDAFSLTVFDDQIELQNRLKSTKSHLQQNILTLQELLLSKERRTTNIAQTIREQAPLFGKRALIILFSDLFDQEHEEDFFESLKLLKHFKHEVLLFHTRDHQLENNFQFENKPYEFIDLETHTSIKLHPNQIREQYQNANKAYEERLKLTCAQLKIDYIPCDVNESVNHVLLPYLIKRQKMK